MSSGKYFTNLKNGFTLMRKDAATRLDSLESSAATGGNAKSEEMVLSVVKV